MSIPATSAPLAASIRTGEGWLVYASNVGLAAAAALPHGLSWTHAGVYLTILNVAHVISRSALKISAVNAGVGIAPPIPPDPSGPIVSEIDTVVAALAALQAQPGTPAGEIPAGLNPEPAVAAPAVVAPIVAPIVTPA